MKSLYNHIGKCQKIKLWHTIYEIKDNKQALYLTRTDTYND